MSQPVKQEKMRPADDFSWLESTEWATESHPACKNLHQLSFEANPKQQAKTNQ